MKTKLITALKTAVKAIEDESGPTWEDPVVMLSSEKTGMFFSLTAEDEYDVVVPWKQFEKSIVESDSELLKKYIPLFKALVLKMEKEVALYGDIP